MSEEEDEILKQLNKKLEDEARDKRIDSEVERRFRERETKEEPDEEEESKPEPRDAVFLDKQKRRRKVTRKKKPEECPHCGSGESRLLETDVIYRRGKEVLYDFSEVRKCNGCSRRFGVVRE